VSRTVTSRPLSDRAAETVGDVTAQVGGSVGRTAIDLVIDGGEVQTLFQPVVHLPTLAVVGFEAFNRGPAGSSLESPIAMLGAARLVGRLAELDWLCRASAMKVAAAAGLNPSLSWFINVEPAGLQIECPDHLRPTLERARKQLRVVLEVVERDVDNLGTRLLQAADQARKDAWGVALDDVGANVASLALLPFLQPDVIKLDMAVIGEELTAESAEVAAAVHAYVERTDAVVVAEGIETAAQEQLAKLLGAAYGQGYLYGRPGPLPRSVPVPRSPIPLRQRPEPVDGATPFDVLSAMYPTRRADAHELTQLLGLLRRHCLQAPDAGVMLCLHPTHDSYRENATIDEAIAQKNALTVALVPGLRARRSVPRYHVAPVHAHGRLLGESALIAANPHYTGALVTRVVRGQPPSSPGGSRPVDYVFTYDRQAVMAASRAFMQYVEPPARP
jgi:EAL domain-containing protein (putative c-di-GMP-specific phosphodiesterase class I)